MTKTFRKNAKNTDKAFKGIRKNDNSSARSTLRQKCQTSDYDYDDSNDYIVKSHERKSEVWNFFPQHKKKYDSAAKFPLFARQVNIDDTGADADDEMVTAGGIKRDLRPPTRRQINHTKERFYINDRVNTRIVTAPYFQTFDEYMVMMIQEYFPNFPHIEN